MVKKHITPEEINTFLFWLKENRPKRILDKIYWEFSVETDSICGDIGESIDLVEPVNAIPNLGVEISINFDLAYTEESGIAFGLTLQINDSLASDSQEAIKLLLESEK